MQHLMKPSARHLTEDEEVTLPDKFGTEMTFRVRIWRGVDATPVVLVSPTTNEDGHTYSPACLSSKLANHVLGPILGHPACMMIYYEDQVLPGDLRMLEQVYFEYYGHAHRLRMYRPERRAVEWAVIEHVLEGAVER